jgi:NAD(P)-dependent dehydrogenase (short-subunit alcohol dehydrogenase family)
MVAFDFTGKVVLITGATGALGRVVARQFHQAGATLALCARDDAELRQLFADLASDPRRLLVGGIDLREPDDCDRLARAVQERFGRLDALVNTVGGFTAGPPVHETPLEDWDAMLAMNLRTAFLVSRADCAAADTVGRGRDCTCIGQGGAGGLRRRGGLLRRQSGRDTPH